MIPNGIDPILSSSIIKSPKMSTGIDYSTEKCYTWHCWKQNINVLIESIQRIRLW